MSEEQTSPTMQLQSTPTIKKPTPEQEKYLELVRQLTDASAILVVKVATCTCNNKDECKVFQQAQKIATIIDAIQDTRFEGIKKEGEEHAVRRGRIREK